MQDAWGEIRYYEHQNDYRINNFPHPSNKSVNISVRLFELFFLFKFFIFFHCVYRFSFQIFCFISLPSIVSISKGTFILTCQMNLNAHFKRKIQKNVENKRELKIMRILRNYGKFFWPQTVFIFVCQSSLWHIHQSPKMFTANNRATELNTNEHLWSPQKEEVNWQILNASNHWFPKKKNYSIFLFLSGLVRSMHVCVLVYPVGFIDWHLLRRFFFFLWKPQPNWIGQISSVHFKFNYIIRSTKN